MVLATSAGGAELSALRRAIDANDAITDTASADDVDEGKPAPEPVEHALELAGVAPEQAVFVGDTVWDMQAGSRRFAASASCAAASRGPTWRGRERPRSTTTPRTCWPPWRTAPWHEPFDPSPSFGPGRRRGRR
ncbi:Phosphoglycolate phosphatase [Streptomyces alboniger]